MNDLQDDLVARDAGFIRKKEGRKSTAWEREDK